MTLLLAADDPTPPLVGLVLLASLAGLALVIWRGARGATAAARGQEEVADLLARGDLDGAMAAGGDRPDEERGRALAGGAWLRLQQASATARAAAYEADEDDAIGEEAEARLLDGAVIAPAVRVVRRALELAPRDGKTLALAAQALAHARAWDVCSAVLADAARLDDLTPAELADLARVAGSSDASAPAADLAGRALRHLPNDLELRAIHGRALLSLDRPADALPGLEVALGAARLQLEGIDAERNFHQLVDLERQLSDLHDDAVRRTSTAEKVIDSHVMRGRLDPRAGVNYKLMAHSLLVESTRRARRLLLPSQAELLRDAEADPDGVVGLEDAALHALREGAFERAEERFRRAADLAPGGWPVLAGLGATLELRKAPSWSTHPAGPSLPALARLVEPWAALTQVERNLVALALGPVAHLVPALADAGARLQVVALDAKLTDLPAFKPAAGTVVEDEDDRRTHDAIDGMAIGLTAAIKIEAFHERDEERWTLAHELGHVLQHFLEARAGDEAEAFAAELDALFTEAERASWRSTEYGLRNVFEFFATGYERFALRHAFPDAPRTEVHGADIDLGVDAFLREWTAP